MSDSAVPATRKLSPGCLLFLVGGVWLLVLGGWMVWSLYGQLREIRTFTDTAAKPVSPAQPTAEQIAALRSRIDEFGAAVGRREKAELRLSVDDLNNLIASGEESQGMRENAKVESIGDTVKVQISVALNGVPFSGERLFLNGTADVTPVAEKDKGLRLRTQNLSVPGRTVTEGFQNQYKEAGHLDTLLLDPLRGSKTPGAAETMQAITNARLEPGTAVIEYLPAP
jgi:hypothetical protein